MKKEMERYFKMISEKTCGAITEEYMDFKDGSSITLDELAEVYEKYIEIVDEVDSYIEENDLDDINDRDKIMKHFNQYYDYFSYPQAIITDFVNFAIKYLNLSDRG